MTFQRLVGLLLVGLGLAGCSWEGKNGERHHLVCGFGVISTYHETGVQVIDSRTVGFSADSWGATVGLGRRHQVEIDPRHASNVVVSIRAKPGGMEVKHLDPLWRPDPAKDLAEADKESQP